MLALTREHPGEGQRRSRMTIVDHGATDQDIVVRAESSYHPGESDDEQNKHVFSYRIEIENRGTETVQLISRHWWITDAFEVVREVDGEGVVGQQPVIPPGETFRYSSWCALPTLTGWMRGVYRMIAMNGRKFEVPVPAFGLAAPHAIN